MASEAQANAPARHPLYRPLWKVFLLSSLTIHIYDYIWYVRISKFNKGRIKPLLPAWPYQIGAILIAYVASYFLFSNVIAFFKTLSEFKESAENIRPYVVVLFSYGPRAALRVYKTFAGFRLIAAYQVKIKLPQMIMTVLLPVTYPQHILNRFISNL